MIIQTHIDIKGRDFIRTTSDEGRFVVRDGVPYSVAYDPAEYGREYTEGDIMPVDESELEDKAEAYDILMGVSE